MSDTTIQFKLNHQMAINNDHHHPIFLSSSNQNSFNHHTLQNHFINHNHNHNHNHTLNPTPTPTPTRTPTPNSNPTSTSTSINNNNLNLNLFSNSSLINQNHPSSIPFQTHSNQLDSQFQISNNHGVGLLPMPVPYEDFHYSIPNLENQNHNLLQNLTNSNLQSNQFNLNPSFISNNSSPFNLNHEIFLNNLINSNSISSRSHSNSNSNDLSNLDFLGNLPPPLESHHQTLNHTLNQKPQTPPPLLDASEKDLLSSFLNIFGNSNAEMDFDPQEKLPDTDQMDKHVQDRLKISDHTLPSWKSSSLSFYPPNSDQNSNLSRKKIKISKVNSNPLQSIDQSNLISQKSNQSSSHHLIQLFNQNSKNIHSSNQSNLQVNHPAFLNSKSSNLHSLDLSPHLNFENIDPTSQSPQIPNLEKKLIQILPCSKSNHKLLKNTHIVSEQRRRNAIQGGFGNLVEILRAGEHLSGISIASPEGNHQSGKPKTRGRGRRGEIETGASKSVVLERAADYVKWFYTGNLALKNEVERIENILKFHGLQF
ncbi:hypothetical protein O181_066751 [Austropuccinia psidii MF-1]|uniref:BHLH domain-containing protein n=1 Tax=Austropuccinia psidii MF-1 TaxID=1389203 RepID=A0A9Q3I2G2_9BASI|nr:hypothetical protein [Austropuccinia psidii MF-1]